MATLTSPLNGVADLVRTLQLRLASSAALPFGIALCMPLCTFKHMPLRCAGDLDLVRQRSRILQIAQAQRLQVRILHLSSLLPRFLTSSDGKHRFSPVLFDFRYFIDSATAEARVESSRHLQSLDEEMRGVCKLLYDRDQFSGVSSQEAGILT